MDSPTKAADERSRCLDRIRQTAWFAAAGRLYGELYGDWELSVGFGLADSFLLTLGRRAPLLHVRLSPGWLDAVAAKGCVELDWWSGPILVLGVEWDRAAPELELLGRASLCLLEDRRTVNWSLWLAGHGGVFAVASARDLAVEETLGRWEQALNLDADHCPF